MKDKKPELGKFIEQYGGLIGATPFKVFILRIGDHSLDEALISINNIDHPIDGKIYRYKKHWNTSDHRDNNYVYSNMETKDIPGALWSIPRQIPQEFEFYLGSLCYGTKVSPLEHQAKLDPKDMYARYIRQKAGETVFENTQDSFSVAEKDEANGNQPDLTKREEQVLIEVALGFSCKKIAEHLFITTNTVNTHKKNLFSKVGVNNNAGLVIFAIKNGYLDDKLKDD